MVIAYYMDDSDEDQRLEHRLNGTNLSIRELYERTGAEYFHLSTDNDEDIEKLSQIKKERGYTFEDEIKIDENMEGYEKKIKMFFEEHIHSDEEIRFIVDGTGYFDLRDKDDKWIRIAVGKGDLLIVPAGIYHRFTLDTKDFIIAKRFFVGEPIWTPINRPCEKHPSRIKYLNQLKNPTMN